MESLLDRVAGLRSFPVNFAKFLIITPYFIKHPRWLLVEVLVVFIRKSASKPQNLKKMLRRSPASSAWRAIFKSTDFS